MADKQKVLIFTAHPDDHICSAGTLMYLKDLGFALHEVVATGGEKGVWWEDDGSKKANFDKEKLVEERRGEIGEASKHIGIDQTTFLGLPDSEITRTYPLIEKMIGIIRTERPAVVFAMNQHDYHYDHREFSKIATEALERSAWSNAPELGESYKVPLVLYMEGFYFGKRHVAVDVTAYQDKKDGLLDVYASQINDGERRLLSAMNHYHGFFRRDDKVVSVESFELPEEFPIYLNGLLEVFQSKLVAAD